MTNPTVAPPGADSAAEIAARHPAGEPLLERGRQIAAVLAELKLDEQLQEAAIWFPLLEAGLVERRTVAKRSSPEIARLSAELDKLGRFVLPAGWRRGGRLNRLLAVEASATPPAGGRMPCARCCYRAWLTCASFWCALRTSCVGCGASSTPRGPNSGR